MSERNTIWNQLKIFYKYTLKPKKEGIEDGKKKLLDKYDIANIKKIIVVLEREKCFYSAYTLKKIFEKVINKHLGCRN